MTTPSTRRRRIAVRALGLGAAALVVSGAVPGLGHAAPAPKLATAPSTTASDSVTLNGEGASDPAAELKGWQNDLYGSNGALDLNYIASGGYKARQDLIAGTIDYAISGVPFTDAEAAQVPGGLIGAPVMASALGVLVTPPYNPSAQTTGDFGWGTLTTNPDGTQSYQPYTGPIKVPTLNLAAMLFNYSASPADPSNNGVPLNQWNNPAIVKAFGIQTGGDGVTSPEVDFTPSGAGESPYPTLRSDPSEDDYYSELLASKYATEVWSGAQKLANSTFTVGDAIPPGLDTVNTRQGLDSQLSQLGVPGSDGTIDLPRTGAGEGGLMAAVPPAALGIFKSGQAPETLAQWVAAQNANGDWVTPSPTSIDAAVNAGGATPFYGLTNNVPGAYPFTYVDQLYAPAHGLSVDNTEAIATVIRYLATDGQNAMAANNDGKLSPALVTQALAAANKLVLSNCTGSGAQVVTSSDPGRFAPSLPGLKSIGSMLHCVHPTSTTSTNAAKNTAVSSSGSGYNTADLVSDTGSSFVPATSGVGDEAPGSRETVGKAPLTASNTTGTAGRARSMPGAPNAALSIETLPISLPFTGGSSFDRFTALILGAALFLVGRRVVSWLLRMVRS